MIGGFVYRGSRLADQLADTYVGGDFPVRAGVRRRRDGDHHMGRFDDLTSFGQDDHREIWAVTIDGGLCEMRAS